MIRFLIGLTLSIPNRSSIALDSWWREFSYDVCRNFGTISYLKREASWGSFSLEHLPFDRINTESCDKLASSFNQGLRYQQYFCNETSSCTQKAVLMGYSRIDEQQRYLTEGSRSLDDTSVKDHDEETKLLCAWVFRKAMRARESPNIVKSNLSWIKASSFRTPFSSSTVFPKALGYCSVTMTGISSALAPLTIRCAVSTTAEKPEIMGLHHYIIFIQDCNLNISILDDKSNTD